MPRETERTGCHDRPQCRTFSVMTRNLAERLVPDTLWNLVAPLIPGFVPRPQGGGTGALDDRDVLAAVVFVLTSGCAWRHLPSCFATSPATAHRRFTAWSEAGLWSGMRQRLENTDLGDDGEWAATIIDVALARTSTRSTPVGTGAGTTRSVPRNRAMAVEPVEYRTSPRHTT
ncbi:transposase [Saccharothrix isguenensis]